jgi:hypothetical protein
MIDSLPLYAPQALFDLNDELDKRRDTIDAQVAKLSESELISEEDLRKIEGYKKKLRLNRFERYWNETLMPLRDGKFAPPETALANDRAAGQPGRAPDRGSPSGPGVTSPAAASA